MLKKDITLVQCIEKKENHEFQENIQIFLNSSQHFLEGMTHNIIQPSNYNIDDNIIDLFKEYNINFLKHIIPSKQINEDINYTNICETVYYYKDIIKTKYLLWLDLDVMFLNETDLIFEETDKIVVSFVDLKIIDDIKSENYSTTDDFNRVYNEFFKMYLKNAPDRITKYVNTWLLFGKQENTFWKEWRELTYELINIVQTYHPEYIDKHFESLCEELAGCILYERNPDNFENIHDYFHTKNIEWAHEYLNEDTFFIHYEKVKYLLNHIEIVKNQLGIIDDSGIFNRLIKRNIIDNRRYLDIKKKIQEVKNEK